MKPKNSEGISQEVSFYENFLTAGFLGRKYFAPQPPEKHGGKSPQGDITPNVNVGFID